jgi:hypothetical protein
MSNRIIKHSSRYKGPAGDSRPVAEIFAGIEARAQQAREYQGKMIAVMNEILEGANLMHWESRIALVRETVVDWLSEKDPDFQGKRGTE